MTDWSGNTLSSDTIVISGNLARSLLQQHTKVLARNRSPNLLQILSLYRMYIELIFVNVIFLKGKKTANIRSLFCNFPCRKIGQCQHARG